MMVCIPQNTIVAKAASADDAIAWVQGKVGQSVGSGECVALIKEYYSYLGVAPVSGNGADYATNALPAGWQRIRGGTPQKGDILVYSGNTSNPYGHVAIFESTNVTYHQNFNYHRYVERITITYNKFDNPYWGVIRPNFSGGSSGIVTAWETSSSYQDNNNAIINATISTSDRVQFTRAGAYVWNEAGGLVAEANEATSVSGYYMNITYNILGELGVKLEQGCTYTYQFWAEFGGNRYYSSKANFITTGSRIYNPEGAVDYITGGKGSVWVRGWAFDRDNLNSALRIHVYVGGPAGSASARGYEIKADKTRTDVNDVYPGVGINHGFDSTINVSLSGQQPIYVYAINIGSGGNVCLGNKSVYIEKTVAATGISLSSTSKTMWVGDEFTNTATITPSNSTDKTVTWSSDNTSVATVNNGKIKAVGVGKTVISAKTSNGKEAKCQVTVKGLPFGDVSSSDWYYNNVYYVYKNNLMTGKTATIFAPSESLARAQFAIILHRLNGTPAVDYTARFRDVGEGIWYTDAILWAADTDVVTGYSNGNFGPGDNINREQMAVMMYRYAAYKGYDTSVKADIGQYQDAGRVSDFAQEAMQWAVGEQIITGKYNETQLDPQGNASRAECATIMMRFMERYEK